MNIISYNRLCNLGMSLLDRVGKRNLTLLSYLGICVSLVILGMGFELSKINSAEVTLSSNSSCGALSSCYDCTYEYDQVGGDDLVGLFCLPYCIMLIFLIRYVGSAMYHQTVAQPNPVVLLGRKMMTVTISLLRAGIWCLRLFSMFAMYF